VYQKSNYLQALHDKNINNIVQYILFKLDVKLI
jgi:hypothetical protein